MLTNPQPVKGFETFLPARQAPPTDRPVYTPLASVCRDRFDLQHEIADVAERLAVIHPRAIDETLCAGLRSLGEALRMEWAIIWCKSSDTATPVVSHRWVRIPQAPDRSLFELASAPFITSALDGASGTWLMRTDDGDDPVAQEALEDHGLRFAAVVPIRLPDAHRAIILGAAGVVEHRWTPALMEQLRVVAAVFAQAIARRDDNDVVGRALDELPEPRREAEEDDAKNRHNIRAFDPSRGRDRLKSEDLHPEDEPRPDGSLIVGRSEAIRRVLEQAQQVAVTDATVLLLGETGTGKELVATHIHELSARRARTMMRVNCSAIPSTLIESELFGREKGAFTGALSRQIGRFESADRSTIFLDEIGDLPPDVQIKLLRVLEERQIERLGSPRAVPVDVRIIAATHRNLEKRIAEEAFREDLFYRLNVFPISVPALRERPEDIPLLVWRFVIEFSKSFGKRIDAIARENMESLQRYSWPGNIRELRNVVERAMILVTGTRLTVALPLTSSPVRPVRVRLEDVEREHIREILERARWRVRGTGGAAEQLGLRPTTLETRMAKLGIMRPKSA